MLGLMSCQNRGQHAPFSLCQPSGVLLHARRSGQAMSGNEAWPQSPPARFARLRVAARGLGHSVELRPPGARRLRRRRRAGSVVDWTTRMVPKAGGAGHATHWPNSAAQPFNLVGL